MRVVAPLPSEASSCGAKEGGGRTRRPGTFSKRTHWTRLCSSRRNTWLTRPVSFPRMPCSAGRERRGKGVRERGSAHSDTNGGPRPRAMRQPARDTSMQGKDAVTRSMPSGMASSSRTESGRGAW